MLHFGVWGDFETDELFAIADYNLSGEMLTPVSTEELFQERRRIRSAPPFSSR